MSHHFSHSRKSLVILTTQHRQAEAEDCQHSPIHHTVSREHPIVTLTVTRKSHRHLEFTKMRWAHTFTKNKFQQNTAKTVELSFIVVCFPAVMETLCHHRKWWWLPVKRDSKFNRLQYCRKPEKDKFQTNHFNKPENSWKKEEAA